MTRKLLLAVAAFLLGATCTVAALTPEERDAVEFAYDAALQIEHDVQTLIDHPDLEPCLIDDARRIKVLAQEAAQLSSELLGR